MNTNLLEHCMLCPRECGVNRTVGQRGFCGQSSKLYAARASLHMWEEPCISGDRGSGAVFFSGCQLRCIFCQNAPISHDRIGKEISVRRLADIFLELEQKGANNINLVSPTHYILHIIDAIEASRRAGLSIPIVYNTSGYEKAEIVRLLEGYIDIWLPDFKYVSPQLSKQYSDAGDYFTVADKALHEMVRQAGEAVITDDGIMKKGVIVRHLQLPGHLADSKKVIRYLYKTFGNSIYISIMNQFTPIQGIEEKFPELNRKVKRCEYDRLVDYAIELGVEQGFIQEGETAGESFIPAFDFEGLSTDKGIMEFGKELSTLA